MIPLNLTVRNFLCYRDDVPPLDLRGVHIACLCGANGHGKSALLDAMTWCLWGQARTGTQNHNDLIAYGETECRVELEFLARDQTYRAIRRRRSAGQGRTELDLFVLDEADQPRPLTGNSVRETGARIQRIVGMDFNTFVNTAFLQQGRSDEFTRKNPSDRKTVLASVLGLGLYDLLQAAARGERDQWQDTVARTEGALAQSQAAYEALQDPTAALEAIAERLPNLEAELATANARVELARSDVAALQRTLEEADSLGERIASLENDIRQADAGAEAIAKRIASAGALVERADEIGAGAARLRAAQDELARLEATRAEYDRLRTRRTETQSAVDRKQAALSAEVSQLERRIEEELRPQADRAPEILGHLEALAKCEQSLLAEANETDARMDALAVLQGEITLREADLARCVSEGRELRVRQSEMQAADAVCPLCRTPLTEDSCENIAAWYASEIQAKLQLHAEIKQALAELSEQKDALSFETEKRRTSLAGKQRKIQQDRGRLEQELRQSEAAQEQSVSAQSRLTSLQRALADGDSAVGERDAVAELDRLIAGLAYDDAGREAAYEMVQSLQHWDGASRDLERARLTLPTDEVELKQTRERVDRWKQELQETETALNAARSATEYLPERQRELQTAEAALARLSSERDALLAQRGRLQGDAERRRAYADELTTLKGRHRDAQGQQSIYAELFGAFGRSGVPAMLIDAAVPRIEAEANQLLGRMTDNRLAVKLETQRDRRDGGVAETLDIFISDELGSRSYDLYSGGEAFRINLALRIALSKVLAQRMGLPMPTLFIDEGFGTQDAAGREKIVDAIASIQDDFEKIIVITHLEELKDLFPVRIEVLKTSSGSQFWLS